jgi:transposase
MRGHASQQGPMFLMINVEDKVPQDHPLRAIKRRCDVILADMRRDFQAAYSRMGRPSIPPEQLLKALLLQALYSIRSEIQLMQAIDFNLLYRWFLDLPGDAPVWTPEVFSMNRQRFAEHRLLEKFFDRIVAEAITEQLASPDHFTVDGTLIRSWASHKSLVPKDGPPPPKDDDPGNPSVNWHGQKRSNATHVSATDPEARLARKGDGQPAHLCHSGHVLMENRHGLCLAVAVDAADGKAERRAAKAMLQHVRRRHRVRPQTLGADTGFDDGQFMADLEADEIVPHVPVRSNCRLRADDAAGQARRRAHRRMKTRGYAISQRVRKRVEEIFGWMKTVGDLARTRFVGRWKIFQEMLVTGAAYNLLRLVRLRPPDRAAAVA